MAELEFVISLRMIRCLTAQVLAAHLPQGRQTEKGDMKSRLACVSGQDRLRWWNFIVVYEVASMNCFIILWPPASRTILQNFSLSTVCMFLYIVLFALSSYSPCIAYTTCGINRCVANIIIIILNLLHKLVNVIITISIGATVINKQPHYETFSDVGLMLYCARLCLKNESN